MSNATHGWPSVLQAAAVGAAGEDGCCMLGDDGQCCMQDNARFIFEHIAAAGGPTLEQCEALARGEFVLVPAVPENRAVALATNTNPRHPHEQ
jgi:hypothetical protein